MSTLVLLGAPCSTHAQKKQSHSSKSAVKVRGYFRKDGTYVRPHYRSPKDKFFGNNWTTSGNKNPFTGEWGWLLGPAQRSQSAIGSASSSSVPHNSLNPADQISEKMSVRDSEGGVMVEIAVTDSLPKGFLITGLKVVGSNKVVRVAKTQDIRDFFDARQSGEFLATGTTPSGGRFYTSVTREQFASLNDPPIDGPQALPDSNACPTFIFGISRGRVGCLWTNRPDFIAVNDIVDGFSAVTGAGSEPAAKSYNPIELVRFWASNEEFALRCTTDRGARYSVLVSKAQTRFISLPVEGSRPHWLRNLSPIATKLRHSVLE
ncbi:MAG TPA: hypothetical protein PKA27_10350 [Fimbriimonadaceae bacterium]|nr:hypothetical protein [Fimbriimonadaceae bacterium]